MCIALVKLPDANVSEDNLRACWQSNPDGAGFAYIKDGKVTIEKGFMTLKPFMEALNVALEANKESTFLIHFRIRSMGDKSADNTHPFEFEHGCMIHNGTMDGTGAKWGDGPSDTALFVKKFEEKLTYPVLEKNKEDIEKAIGSNKLAFLFHDGTHFIVNAAVGNWDNGVWYSNYSYRPRLSTSTTAMEDYTSDNWSY